MLFLKTAVEKEDKKLMQQYSVVENNNSITVFSENKSAVEFAIELEKKIMNELSIEEVALNNIDADKVRRCCTSMKSEHGVSCIIIESRRTDALYIMSHITR